MFEAHVLHLLRRYLGEYVHGLSAEALRISVWKGDVVLRDLKLKAEALNLLKLPVTVKAGFVGTITLKVPWKSLGKEPVIVLIDRVFVLAQPAPDGRTLKEVDGEKLFEAKIQQIEEAESATLEAISRSKLGISPPANSWLGSLISTIIGNLKITISNVHIRYEDSVSNPGHPFTSGVTLAKLAAVTMDEQGNETFDTSGALDKLRKFLQVERLALYHDSNSEAWKIEKNWEDLTPKEWVEIFEDGISEPATGSGVVSKWAQNRNYLVSPINGILKYHRLGKQERNDPEVPFEKASLSLHDVSLTITEAQYHDSIRILEVVSRYKTYIEVSHLRPTASVKDSPYLWWRYALHASLQQKKMSYRFSWDRIQHFCHLRRCYVQLYAGFLQQSLSDISKLRKIEKDLDSKVILLWRLLAHAKVESVKSKEAAEQRRLKKRSWFSFRGRSPSDDVSVPDASEEPQSSEGRLTTEEWQAINNLLSYQPDEDLNLLSGKDMQNMVKYLVNVSIGQAAARIINMNQTEILCGRFEQLDVSTKIRHRSIHCNVSLKFYGLNAPEGSLAQSVSSKQKENALVASFVHSPVGEHVDWRLSATISPCHVTVLVESYARFLEFMQRSKVVVSPTFALETATALQMKIEKVTRRAQEQFQMVLEEQSRFALDIDLDAPKVRVPIRTCGLSRCDSHFLLDFGHFTLHTKETESDEQRQSLYSQFYITGRNIAAFFRDCGSDCQNCTLVSPAYYSQPTISPAPKDSGDFYSLIDRCGMAVVVDQIKVPHPSYPSMRVSVQVPNLGIHFSPARYCRLMELLDILHNTMEKSNKSAVENCQVGLAPWYLADLATDARILVWRGIGYSVATWQPCFLVLSNLNLYVLESETSQSYMRCASMSGKQVYEVPPDLLGGSLFCIAVSFRGMDIQKALESSSTLVFELRDGEEKATWLKGLTQATYQASAPVLVDVLGESSDDVTGFGDPRASNLRKADLVISGALLETKLFIYGKVKCEGHGKPEEVSIVEILAGGGKVHIVCWEGDLTVKMKLHSLRIKDELQGCLSTSSQYLACSVQKTDCLFASPIILDPPGEELSMAQLEEDDIFKDALQDFMSFPDQESNLQHRDAVKSTRMEDVIDFAVVDSTPPFIHGMSPGKGKGSSSEIFFEAENNDSSDFVSVTFFTRNPGSPDYDGIDTQMSIHMSKLEFFCNRPTIVALIDFGLDLSSRNSASNSSNSTKASDDESMLKRDKTEENECVIVKGLLGYGKGRVVFYLNMNMDNLTVFLNKEDGSQLAMLIQESFLLDLKVRPTSLSIDGTLGNFRLRDMAFETDDSWGWLCDIRYPGVESLIKFTFKSYGIEDDDYKGYDFSLCGRLSAVRIVFLNRFIQEVTAYFMGLATPHTEEVIKLVDKVGDLEWLIKKDEMDGASAIKLDLSLDTPIIIVPRNSMSKDFLQLDLGQLKVSNEVTWHGNQEKDASAVHLDILHAEILGINMSVGINGCIGKPMIREGQGLDIFVRRSLRDVFRKIPTFSLEVKVGLLHIVMSDKEYSIILDCACMNLSEEPRLPPNFRGSTAVSEDPIRLLVDKVNMNSHIFLSRTVTIVGVEINYALLELCNAIHEESPLAHVALEGLWVSYRMTSLSETDLYVTIPKFSILDIRPDIKPEMRLMLGSSADVSNQASTINRGGSSMKNLESVCGAKVATSTMFLMDYRLRASSQSYVIRLQQPRVLVVPDFLLAVGEFFVPALGAITGREELMDPKNDPIMKSKSIVLSEPIHKQIEDVVHLSPDRQLVVDALGVYEYTYDGCGKTICLSAETDCKEICSSRSQSIVIIGRGKRLRFVNVKIENGSLLRRYTYLSNDSSYSVLPEDGVDILLLNQSSYANDETNLDYMDETSDASDTSGYTQSDSSKMQSFTFEAQIGLHSNIYKEHHSKCFVMCYPAQCFRKPNWFPDTEGSCKVVSPEFTFYDGTKLYLGDFTYGEKLLRAKMDLSFMYASKEDDTWIRALMKDLTLETGSGLIVLDPVDISGGYTSVKDKTDISLVATDICIHLSLSVISLVLNLQNQTTAALQFGNANPVAPCTNFDRVWVSPKENGTHDNLTFWRPRPPSNYVVLGDCVTSRPTPPSQAVMAVSNTYQRVRKPLGFKLIGSFSGIQGLEAHDDNYDMDNDCSIWMPLAPPGYLALGYVAHVGVQPPPNHIVYCVRSDLVTSTTYLDCIFNARSSPQFSSGFSIWRVDNALGSFLAHPSGESPPKNNSCDLSQLVQWNSNRRQSSDRLSSSAMAINHNYESQRAKNQSAASSGWEILRSISRATTYYMSTPNFERIWWDKGSDMRRSFSIWRPVTRPGYGILGDCITEGLEPPALCIIFKADNPEISAKPVQFTKVAHIVRKGIDEAFFWYPIAPPGYASLGCIVSRTDEAPQMDLFCCPRMDLVNPTNILEVPISRSSSSKASHCWSIWKVENQACTFLARSDAKKPSSRLAYTIGDSVEPKTRENITAEMKLRCLSLTVLDSLCGTMMPLFDTTISNIKLATHGRLEAMNAVLISSIAASTFNTQLEAWEPLVEPFDGIFKFETYDANTHPPSRLGKRVRIAATSILNVNVSAANLEAFVETVVSWRRHRELEQKAARLNEEAGSHHKHGDGSNFSALDENDFQTVIIENKLGCDIYVKRVEQNSDSVELLHHDGHASVWIPPPRFSDRLNVADELQEARYYVAIQILEAQGLPIIDDGNSHKFFCALRLVVDSQATDQQKFFPQSARTKCVEPSISKIDDIDEGTANWNELFIFEVPQKGLARLEVEVTNLAAKAGKGEVLGAFSISVERGKDMLKRVASVRTLHQSFDNNYTVSYPLQRRGQLGNDEDMCNFGSLSVSTSFFERKKVVNFQDMESENSIDRDIGFRVGLSPEGAWESFRSLLPLSVIPRMLEDDLIAVEVVMKNGKKHAIFRSLATVANDSDVKMDISICSMSMLHCRDVPSETSRHNIVVEEVFQNQRYHPISGWGNKWPGFHTNDPGHWSSRDFSYSSKDFFEPPIPDGWKWASGWCIDKSQFVDADGWAYGPDYQSLKWPPKLLKSDTKSTVDLVRRRRWIRTREQVTERGIGNRSVFAVINPGSSSILPWKCMSKDLCLQVRPCINYSQPSYSWGQAVAIGPGQTMKQGNKMAMGAFKLNELEKKDMLFCCRPDAGSRLFWLSVGADASILHTELNLPVYDWKISINSPLKLDNRLPCPAEFTLWEKTKEGNSLEREHGVVSSRESVNIYSVDVQRPIYLSLFVQGGWVLEKDPILILDLSSNEHVASFWMVHQQTKRRLRMRIEREMGECSAAPKTIRFFVPYWISNDSSLPLTYQVVEIDPAGNADVDSLLLSRAVRSAKTALKNPIMSMERRHPGGRKNIQVLEVIEDTAPTPSMLSPQDYASRSGVNLFPSRNEAHLSPRVGISVAIRRSENFSPGISLFELENKRRVDVKAFHSYGSYYKLSALMNVTSDRTKVVHFQPHTLFINRVGCSVCLQQCYSQSEEWIHPTDPPKPFRWITSAKVELLKLRLDGYKWSYPFSIDTEGVMCISLKKDTGGDKENLRVEVRSGTKSSCFEVIFRPNSSSSPYRIENRSMFLPICFRQVDGSSDSWRSLLPNSAASFLWEDVGRKRLLELLVDGTDQMKSEKYDIDEVSDHQPIHVSGAPVKALRVTILKEEKMNVIKISDWMPENELMAITSERLPASLLQISTSDQCQKSPSTCEFHVIVELAELGISIIDHTPEEILYLSVQNLFFSHSSGLGSGISRFKLRMLQIQVDNQLPLTPMPVLFRPQRSGDETDCILKFSMTLQTNGSLDLCVYPYIGFHGPENSAFLINIHEPIIWRLHEMIQQVNLHRLHDSQTTAVSVDPIIQIGVLNISEVRLKVSMAMSPSQRPRGVLGFWSSLMTALGNMENMPIRMHQRFHENLCMRQSAIISFAISNIQKDLLSQPFQLLYGVDILGNASSALGHMSKGVAALSMDKKFIQGRQRQENKGVEDIGDVIREGGGALAKGLFRGVTGILTKPLEGAKSSGVEGFVQGVGKGIIGAAAQPVSGVLDLLSKTTEGANAVRMKIASAITSEEQLLRRRLPRVISGDNLLRPYDEYKAQGQVILQLAESGSFFSQVDLFKVRGKFALSDAYEDHFLLPKGKILVVTHRRVILLQQPSNIIGQRKFIPARDPCSVLWEVLWNALVTMELTHGRKDPPEAPPSRLILYLQSKSTDTRDQTRVIKCGRESHQAFEVYSSIERAMDTYGPKKSKATPKTKVTKPYAPAADDTSAEMLLKEGTGQWASHQMLASVLPRSTFGSSSLI